jgi:hypothetical protein
MPGWRWVTVLFLIPITIHLYMHLLLSRSRVYEQTHLGMRLADVQDLLRKGNVACVGPGFTSPVAQPNEEASCRFEDPWREYVIAFDSKTQGVVVRQVTYKSVFRLPSRAARLLFGRTHP